MPFCDIKYSPYLIIACQIGNSFPKWLGLLPIPGACLGSVAGSCRDGLIMVVQATEPFRMSASVYKSSPLAHATRYPSRNAPLRFLLLLSSPAPPRNATSNSNPVVLIANSHHFSYRRISFKMQFRNLLVALFSLAALVAAAPVVSLQKLNHSFRFLFQVCSSVICRT